LFPLPAIRCSRNPAAWPEDTLAFVDDYSSIAEYAVTRLRAKLEYTNIAL
jgi:hypothetical protein